MAPSTRGAGAVPPPAEKTTACPVGSVWALPIKLVDVFTSAAANV